MKMKNKTIISLTAVFFFICAMFAYNQVDNSLSKEDKQYIPLYLKNIMPLSKNKTYEDEIKFIISVQDSITNIVSNDTYPIPFNQTREPKDLYDIKTGWCHDRSRVIEKALRYSGFETRHISMYSTNTTGSSIESLLTPGNPSHALTEVMTKKGWLIVDPSYPWISVNTNGDPVSIDEIRRSIENDISIQWGKKPPVDIYIEPFTFVYGLYSRHGRFYPPYNFIPDINYPELMNNFR